MSLGCSPTYRLAIVGLLAALTVAWANWDQAQARASRHAAKHRAIHGPDYRPPYAAIVIDGNSGEALHETSADDSRHPASLTKIMTLYLLFEELDAGRLKLDTPLAVSNHAALQNPTKLNLKANATITVEEAIKGMVTKSANDAAVVVSETIGGSESDFALRMTQKARALGMAGTTYVNASGLPDLKQITTARDQALLGRAIQDRFPGYYRYFSTPNFRYKGVDMHNHNSLLGQVEGVDGIKTGYTEASGYNLTSSVRRKDRHIVAVVLGGTSNAARDTRMRELIERYIPQASAQRTAPKIMEATGPDNSHQVNGSHQDNANAPVDAIAPAAPTPAPVVAPGGSVGGAATATTKAVPAEAAKSLALASKPETQAAKSTVIARRASHHAPPRPATSKATTSGLFETSAVSAAGQSRSVERKAGAAARQ